MKPQAMPGLRGVPVRVSLGTSSDFSPGIGHLHVALSGLDDSRRPFCQGVALGCNMSPLQGFEATGLMPRPQQRRLNIGEKLRLVLVSLP
jgi:hypothetical protein